MSLHRFSLLLCALLVLCAPVQAQIYKYIDSNGNLVLTDTPPKDKDGKVETIETRPLMTVPAFPVGKQPPAAASAKKATNPGYVIVIQNPEPGATYQRHSGEAIPVAVSVSPSVLSGHRLVYLLDGKAQDGAIGSLQAEELDRGTHRLEVKVTGASGEALSSAAVEFNIQQTSALGPTAPKPKPRPN